jgi:hypothetical protein
MNAARVFACLFLVSVVSGQTLAAAEQPQQPDEPRLFRHVPETTRPVFLLNVSVYGGSGDSRGVGQAPGDATDVANPLWRQHTTLESTVSYVRGSDRRTLNTSVGTAMRYLPSSREVLTLDRNVRLDFDTRLGARSRFSTSQSLRYSPYRQFSAMLGGSFPDSEAASFDPDAAGAVGQPTYDIGSTLSFSRNLSRRSSLTLGYSGRHNASPGSNDRLQTHRADVNFRYGLSPYMAFVLGTAARFGQSGLRTTSARARAQDIDLGVDYDRPLSFGRTTLAFSSGTALISQTGGSADDPEAGHRLRLIGRVTAIRPFGRGWEGRIAYDRNVRWLDGFGDPFYASGVMARLTGQVGERISLRVQAHHSDGMAMTSASDSLEQRFRSLEANARVAVAISPNWQFYAEYFHNENDLSAGALMAFASDALALRSARGVRVGLDLWTRKVH